MFKIQTDTVSDAASSIQSIADKMSSLSGNVGGFSAPKDSDFDFEGPKGKIAANLEACSNKISNTAMFMKCVVESHDQLQNSSFKTPEEAAAANNQTSGSESTGYSSGGYSSTGYSSSGYSSTGYSSSGYSSGGSSAVNGISRSSSSEVEDDEATYADVDPVLSSVGYAFLSAPSLSSESREIFSNKKFKYEDSNGYAMIDDRYVIAADRSIGDVGDVIRFNQEDGSTVECVVGVNTSSVENREVVNFIVDKNMDGKFEELDVSRNILNNNESVENYGNYLQVRSKVTGDPVSTENATDNKANLNTSAEDSTSTDNSSANESKDVTNTVDSDEIDEGDVHYV